MSIQSEITRISGNVSDALAAIADKGVTVPVSSTSDDLADLIGQITGGGGTGAVIDRVEQLPGGGDHHIITGVDISGDTVTAAHLETGYTAHDAEGNAITGTLSPGGGGLEYEMGTYTPTEDIAGPTISFINSHTTPPTFAMVADETGTLYESSSTTGILGWGIWVYEYAFGDSPKSSSTGYYYGRVHWQYKSSSSTGQAGNNLTGLSNTSGSHVGYYITQSGITPATSTTTSKFIAGRTYKWIAVWAPTT